MLLIINGAAGIRTPVARPPALSDTKLHYGPKNNSKNGGWDTDEGEHGKDF